MSILDIIRKRRSVRTFDGTPLSEDDANRILEFANKQDDPYGLAVEWKILNAKEEGLSTPVITGTDTFIAGKMKKAPHAEEAFGYAFEKVVLFAESIGVGTTWIAGTMDRAAFERAMAVSEDEAMPCISPLGYPAKKMSFRESMMRKGVKADSRLAFEDLFFDGSFDVPLTKEAAGRLEPLLEAVRLAPSAVNRQPWRIVVCGNDVHFYKASGKLMSSDGWDIQKIDIGIALCHFEMMAEECGISTSFRIDDPNIPSNGFNYMASFTVGQ